MLTLDVVRWFIMTNIQYQVTDLYFTTINRESQILTVQCELWRVKGTNGDVLTTCNEAFLEILHGGSHRFPEFGIISLRVCVATRHQQIARVNAC